MEDEIFEDLLVQGSSGTTHENNIHKLLIEINRSLNHTSPAVMQ